MDPFSRPDENPPGSEALRRWVTIWNVISVVMALFTAIFALVDKKRDLPTTLLIIGFAAVFLLWYWAFIVHLDRWGRSSPVLALSFAVIMLSLAGMTTISGIYYMQLFSMYGIVFSVMVARLAIPLTTLLSILGAAFIIFNNRMTLSAASGVMLSFSIAAFFSTLMGLFISAIIRQSSERQQMIDELKAAREELARAERAAGIFEERQRLAREIHDTLAQGFTSIVMHLEAADQALSGDPALSASPALNTTRQHLERARATARDSLAEARRFVWALRAEPPENSTSDPSDLVDRSDLSARQTLAQAIRRVALRWAEETGLKAQVEISGSERLLPSPFEVTLLRTTQEALVNVRKHAAAQQVTVTLTYMDDQVILDIQDDGQGFDPGPSRLSNGSAGETAQDGSGFGLIGMRERAEQLGGSLIIESAPGEGTTLVVALPLSPAARPTSEAS